MAVMLKAPKLKQFCCGLEALSVELTEILGGFGCEAFSQSTFFTSLSVFTKSEASEFIFRRFVKNSIWVFSDL